MDCIFPFMKKRNKKNKKNTHNDDAGSAGLNGRMERDNGLQNPIHVERQPVPQTPKLVVECRYPTTRYYTISVPRKPPKQDSDREGKVMPKPQIQFSREWGEMPKNAYLYFGLALCCVILNLLIILFLRMYGVTNPILRIGLQVWIMILMLGCFFTSKSRYSPGAFKPVHLTKVRVRLFAFSSFVVFISLWLLLTSDGV